MDASQRSQGEEAQAARSAGDGGDPPRMVVGVGASAGGLSALKTFFASVPEDSGLSYVVVVHLSPSHESHLADVLQPHVKMPVQQVAGVQRLERDHVYVIPPNANLESIDSHLRLSKLEARPRERAPIDHFLRTLATTHDGDTIGVILTGTGSDGALGIKEIKERHGLTIAQDPGEAEYDGMPQSAIATGLVDLVLPVAQIPAAILRFARSRPRIEVPDEAGDLDAESRRDVQRIFTHVRAHTGRDFSRYKRSTIMRRIKRRMQLHAIEELGEYLDFLRRQRAEARALTDDLLITVTNFFRDADVFDLLETRVVPALFEGKGGEDDIRVWSVGCATGEEAYSLAMLMIEEAERRDVVPRIQIFASDLHERSVERAREGLYAGEISSDVSEARLRRFFEKEAAGYRVRKEVREIVVFTPHNLLGDPPFSRLDLIACRNLLIYLQREVQQEVVNLFHYALRPEGFLLLGTSETVGDSGLFVSDDKKRCLFRKRNVPAPEPRLPVFPLSRTYARPDGAHDPEQHDAPVPYGRLHDELVERYAPPSLLLSLDDRVVHVSESAGRYLVHPGGEITQSALKLVRPELRIELRSLLHAARERDRPMSSKPISVSFEGESAPVVLHVRPARAPKWSGYALVFFEERGPVDAADDAAMDEPARVRELQADLDLARQRLQAVIEEYETSQEEMKASNEELQSTNEELRSTMEELETSKEELQSMNEELQTVNQENRHKVEELAQLTGDLQNLLTATDIATLFLDREMRIMRFTPKVGDLFNMRAEDRGRPVSDITHRLGYRELVADVERVLARLVPIERELQDEAGRWYLTRVLPYRSAADRIEGTVITFVEITRRREAELAVRQSEERLAAELAATEHLHELVARLLVCPDVATALDESLAAALEITGAQRGAAQLLDPATGTLELVVQRGFGARIAEPLVAAVTGEASPGSRAIASRERVVVEDVATDAFFARHRGIVAAAEVRALQVMPLISRGGELLGALSTYYAVPRQPSARDLRLLDLYVRQATDFIERVRTADALREKTAELEEQDRRKEHFLAMLGHEIRNPLAALDSAVRVVASGAREPAEIQPMIAEHVSQLMSLVGDLLDLSRVTRDKITLRKSRVDVALVVHRAAQAVRSSVRAKSQEIVLPADDDVYVSADRTRLEQIVSNLLSNASQYTPSGGHIAVTLERDGDEVVIAVEDDGRGLLPDQLANVFEPFVQGRSTSDGLGIGLALVRSLVELHGGSVSAESDGPGRGSVFTVRMPVGDVDGAPADDRGGGEAPSLSGAPSILIVDDERDAADMLALLLEVGGSEARCAYTGADAIEAAARARPDAALVDIGLPDMPGYDVARRIRAQPGGERVLLVALTGYGTAEAEAKGREAGFDAWLLKPVDHDKLSELLAHHVERGRR